MDKNFYKIKRKYFLYTILKCAVCGVSAGLLAVGAVLLALKLSAISLAPYYYAIIGVGCALAAAAVVYVIIRPTDKKVAKKVDNEYSLRERVQTTLEYSGRSGTIVSMQRADTSERLSSLPARRIPIAKILKYAAVFIVAAAIAVTGFIVPQKRVEGEEDPYNRPPTEFEILALEELIKNVEDSSLEQGLKTSVLGSLNGLIEELRPAATVSEVMPSILASIDFIDTTLSAVNSYESLCQQFTELQFNDFAEALKGANVYKEYRLISYDLVQSFEKELISLLNARVEGPIARYRETYNNLESPMAAPVFKHASDTIAAAIEQSGADSSNGVVAVLQSFKEKADEFFESINNGSIIEGFFQHNVDLTFYEFTDDLIDALKEQCYTLGMNRFILFRLKTIFNLPIDEEGENAGAGDKGELPENPGTNPDDTHQGGYGGGETQYGSDDEIYDPNTGKYVKYGELLAAYYAIVLEYLSSGSLTEEQAAMASYYFEILFSGFQAES